MKYILYIILLLFFSNFTIAQSGHKLRLEADEQYSNGQHEEAEVFYKKALEKEEEFKANYNLGNTLYNQQRFEEATEAYQKALGETTDKLIKSKLYHNLGNSYFQNKKLKESVESFKESLRLNPEDNDTRKNLSLVKQIIKQIEQQEQKQEEQNKDQNQDQDQDQNEDDKKKEEDKENREEKEDKKDEQQQQEEQQEKEDTTNQNEQLPQPGDSTKLDTITISKKEMQKLLKAIENDDKEIQKKVRKVNSKSTKKDKDW